MCAWPKTNPARTIAAISATFRIVTANLHVAADFDAVIIQPGEERISTIAKSCPYLQLRAGRRAARAAAEVYKIPD